MLSIFHSTRRLPESTALLGELSISDAAGEGFAVSNYQPKYTQSIRQANNQLLNKKKCQKYLIIQTLMRKLNKRHNVKVAIHGSLVKGP